MHFSFEIDPNGRKARAGITITADDLAGTGSDTLHDLLVEGSRQHPDLKDITLDRQCFFPHILLTDEGTHLTVEDALFNYVSTAALPARLTLNISNFHDFNVRPSPRSHP